MAITKKAAATKKKRARKKIRRSYKGPDWYLIEQSQTLCDIFTDDKADFIAFDGTYADPWQADVWQAAIDAAVNYTDDTTVQAEVLEKTSEVNVLMETARGKYSQIIYFAEEAFGKSSPVLTQFGKGKTYTTARKNQGKMFNFLDELHKAADKHKVKLGTVGCTQAIIDSIATVRDLFNTGNRDQNMLITERLEISQGRVLVNNALHKITMKVIKATKSIYKTNPAKLSQYIYNPPIHHRGSIIFEFDAEPNVITQINPVGIDSEDIETVQFEATDSNFTVYAAAAASTEPGTHFLLVEDGNPEVKTLAELAVLLMLNETNNLILTKNTGGVTGHFKVTFVKKTG